METAPTRADGEDPRVMSASQINVWNECRRKWAWKYVARLKVQPHASAALGSKVHTQLERYLTGEGTPDFVVDANVAEIAWSGLQHLPSPGTPGLEVEKSFKFTSPTTGIAYRGFIDVQVAPGEDGVPFVLDHKTTSDLKWAKTPEDLLTDTQAILYARQALDRWPDAPKVRLQWTYFQTRKTKKSLPVLQEVTRQHVEEAFPLIEKGAIEILHTLKAGTQPLELPPNTRACREHGGCPFVSNCNLSVEEEIEAMSNPKTEALLTRLDSQKEPSLFDALLGTPSPAPAPEPEKEIPLPAWATAPVDPGPGKLPVSDQPINPPEYQAPPATANQPVAVAPEVAAALPEKKKPGRKPGSKNAPKATALPDQSVSKNDLVASPDSAPEPTCAPEPEGFTLYVDCIPIGRPATVLEKLVARAQSENTAATGKADYRMHDFGQGPGVLSGLVSKYVDEGTYGDIVLDTRTPEGAACKAALMAKASSVVMGIGR